LAHDEYAAPSLPSAVSHAATWAIVDVPVSGGPVVIDWPGAATGQPFSVGDGWPLFSAAPGAMTRPVAASVALAW
jgi:hypothetical protein